MSVKLAVFDCDGTLVDGQAAICAAMEPVAPAAPETSTVSPAFGFATSSIPK